MNKIIIIIILMMSFESIAQINIKKIKDTRTKVSENTSTKYSKRSGYLTVKYEKSHEMEFNACTATYISEYFLITSAHCVYKADKGFIVMGTYTPESMGIADNKWESKFIKNIYVMNDYIKLSKYNDKNENFVLNSKLNPVGPEYDIAILEINRGVKASDKKKTGWNSLYYLSKNYDEVKDKKKWDVMMFSYPSDKPKKTMWRQDGCQAQMFSDNLYFHNCSNARGASGSSLLFPHPRFSPQYNADRRLNESIDSEDRLFIMGVNSAISTTGLSLATRINKDRFTNIRDIISGKSKYSWGRMFTKKTLDIDSFYNAKITNKCNRRIQVAVSFSDLKNNIKNLGYFRVDKNKSLDDLIKTEKGSYLVWASTSDGRNVLTKEEGHRYKINNLVVNMERVIMDEGEGYYEKKIYCN